MGKFMVILLIGAFLFLGGYGLTPAFAGGCCAKAGCGNTSGACCLKGVCQCPDAHCCAKGKCACSLNKGCGTCKCAVKAH